MVSQDMIQLRTFMIAASIMGIIFNLLQPVPLVAPACWGLIFTCGHALQIVRFCLANSNVTMNDCEHDFYEYCFMAHGFTPRQFMAILESAHAQWITFAAEQPIVQQGKSMTHAFVLIEGSYVVSRRGEHEHEEDRETVIVRNSNMSVQKTGGVWVGECWDPKFDAEVSAGLHKRWGGTVRAADGTVRAVRFDMRELHAAIREVGAIPAGNSVCIASLRQHRDMNSAFQVVADAQSRECLGKLHAEIQRKTQQAYDDLVILAVADSPLTAAEAEALWEYRKANGISEEQHAEAMRRHKALQPEVPARGASPARQPWAPASECS